VITVVRHDVARLVVSRLRDGNSTLVAEAVEFHASCGCRCVFGMRLDLQEKTMGYAPCSEHEPFSEHFMTKFTGPDAPAEMETGEWMAQLLQKISDQDDA
jgi:hypothetical protein